MNTETKKALLGFGLGLALFVVIVKVFGKKGEPGIDQPPITQANINLAADTYRLALQEGESPDKLLEINNMLAKEYGLRVSSIDRVKLTVADLSGKEVKTFES